MFLITWVEYTYSDAVILKLFHPYLLLLIIGQSPSGVTCRILIYLQHLVISEKAQCEIIKRRNITTK